MKYLLKNDYIELELDSTGAYINKLVYNNQDIFFPKKTLETEKGYKIRGGMHLCLPQFSQAQEWDLVPHGFARDIEWHALDSSENHLVLQAEKVDGKYANLLTKLFIYLNGNNVEMKIVLENKGVDDLEVAPAFHPYFLTEDKDVQIDDKTLEIDVDRLDQTVYEDGIKSFKTSEYKLDFSVKNLNYFAIWTDGLGPYLCLEPNHSKDSFYRQEGYDILKPGQVKPYEFNIKIN